MRRIRPNDDGTVTCSICVQHKPIDQFYSKSKKRGSGLTGQCKECVKAKAMMRQFPPLCDVDIECTRCHRILDASKFAKCRGVRTGRQAWCRECNRSNSHKIELDILISLKNAQGNRCAVCRTDLGDSWHVDHDHSDMKLRGLLCNSCNIMEGRIRSKGDGFLDRMSSYMSQNFAESVGVFAEVDRTYNDKMKAKNRNWRGFGKRSKGE